MKFDIRLDDKIAIITGAAMGIGRGIAQALASIGAHVIIADIMEEEANITAGEIANNYKAEAYRLDVTRGDQFKCMIDYILDKYGRIDILINNAAIHKRKLAVDLSEQEWAEIISVNLNSVFIGCKSVIPIMISQNSGKIINVSSILGIVSLPKHSAYWRPKGG